MSGGLIGLFKNSAPMLDKTNPLANNPMPPPQHGLPVIPDGVLPPLQQQPGDVPMNPMPKAQPGFLSKVGDRLGNPLAQFSMNLIANSQPSTQPQGLGTAMGQSMDAVRTAQRDRELEEILRALQSERGL